LTYSIFKKENIHVEMVLGYALSKNFFSKIS